jgi:copper chaperone
MPTTSETAREREEKTFDIDGMGCEHCVSAIRDALSEVDSVAVVGAEIGSATVRFDPSVTNHIELAAAIADAGYTVVSSS